MANASNRAPPFAVCNSGRRCHRLATAVQEARANGHTFARAMPPLAAHCSPWNCIGAGVATTSRPSLCATHSSQWSSSCVAAAAAAPSICCSSSNGGGGCCCGAPAAAECSSSSSKQPAVVCVCYGNSNRVLHSSRSQAHKHQPATHSRRVFVCAPQRPPPLPFPLHVRCHCYRAFPIAAAAAAACIATRQLKSTALTIDDALRRAARRRRHCVDFNVVCALRRARFARFAAAAAVGAAESSEREPPPQQQRRQPQASSERTDETSERIRIVHCWPAARERRQQQQTRWLDIDSERTRTTNTRPIAAHDAKTNY